MDAGYAVAERGADTSASLPAPWRTQSGPPQSEVRKGTWFDEAVTLRDPEGEALMSEVLALIAAVETRGRKRRETDERNHQAAVRRLLANGLRSHYFRRPSLVAYLRKADGYGGGPGWLTGAGLSRTVDLLVEAGLFDASLGRRGGASSTYSVTERLCELAKVCGVTDHSLTVHVPLKSLVRLREGGSGTPQIAFRPSIEAIRWTGRLRAYNAFIAQQDIGLALTVEEEEEWVRRWNEKRNREGEWDGCRLYRPELIQTDLYRQFNNHSFEQGGRLYGGWWINTPKILRPKITINGRSTVELDFSGCAIRMLYHERGLECRDDPYRLDAIAAYEVAKGLPPNHFRKGIKAITQALINDRNGSRTEMIRLHDAPSFLPGFTRPEVRRMIEEKHAPIAGAFGTGAGLRLQRIESDLALDVISELMRKGVVALPIHDSFLVDREHGFITGVMMSKLYRARFRFNPVIK